ncbi:hypothetical protein [Faecalibacillus faecis]|uniref:hypothetical protein n=1 Tax=Faecalibacillus faecis TaxID=1982628 RepID=UPI003867E271
MTRERDRIQENANKYIVKNCKSNYKLGGKYICDALRIPHYLCQDCTDCIIKQVIEVCKWETNIDVNDRGNLAERILSSFDIEEINK